MFHFDKKERLDLPLISTDYNVLLDDGDVTPILWMGKNKYGEYILGSLIEEDDENKIIWHLHTIIKNETYNQFMTEKISYLQILSSNANKYLIGISYDEELLGIYPAKLKDIPEKYRPLASSYYIDVTASNYLKYSQNDL